jgi:hypothetical protein
LLLIAFAGGCSFSTDVNSAGGDDAPPGDGSVDARPDTPAPTADARVCFGSGFGMTCLPTAPGAPRQLPSTNNFDTSASANCTHVITIGAVETCVLTGTTVTMPGGSTFRAIGSRPLVIVASQTVDIIGNVNVSSLRGQGNGAGAATSGCAEPAAAESDSGGGGGGAGGSFGGRGGNGGIGDTNDNGGQSGTGSGASSLAAPTAPTAIRAGCPGGDGGDGDGARGQGGMPGGAIYIIAGDLIRVTGGVASAGMGGGNGDNSSGGGGGGSGGFIGLDAPAVEILGAVAANGGGGGEGAGFAPGNAGNNGTTNATRAAGGSGNIDGGNGGQGSGGAAMVGDPGGDDIGGGGGGGGGAGYIYVKGTLTGAGTISPAASVF